jgi:cytochrome oxidase Cu insertion factor (SCO1/SenC/PrrC family)
MRNENKFPIMLIIGVLTSFILGLGALLVIATADSSRTGLPILGQVPGFEFVKQNGAPFGLRDMAGKISVVDFMFTSCREACPVMSSNMARLYEQFEGTPKVQFVSISVDPARDSLTVLQSYAASFGVTDDRWVFLWQPIDDVAQLSEKGFMLSSQNLPEGHSSKFALVDDRGAIRGYYDGLSESDLIRLGNDIIRLLKAMNGN